jgi:hypothetical protein
MTHELDPADLAWFYDYCGKLNSADLAARAQQDGQYQCPCCCAYTLHEPGGYDICPICWWEDDGQDDPHAEEHWYGPNGALSLSEGRANYARYGIIFPPDDPRHALKDEPRDEP